MRAFFTTLGRLVLQLFGLVARFQAWLLGKVCPCIPGWTLVEAACRKILAPAVALGGFLQRRIPGVRSLEWLLEIDAMRARHPVLLAFALTMVFVRGLQTTDLGHIGTDVLIYPLLGGLSYLNPFIGLCAAIVFGAGDLIQKLLVNDMYGTGTTGDYVGALFGYLIAYSSLAVMGLAPGMLSRVFSLVVRKVMKAIFFREAAAAADGVRDGSGGDPFRRHGADGAERILDSGIREAGPIDRAVPADAWQQTINAGSPVAPEWQRFFETRAAHDLPGNTLEHLRIPPEGLRAAIEQTGAPPGGWGRLCSLTGAPVEPWMNVPGAMPPGGPSQWLAAHGIPAGPPVPSAVDSLAQSVSPVAIDEPVGPRRELDAGGELTLSDNPSLVSYDDPRSAAAAAAGRGVRVREAQLEHDSRRALDEGRAGVPDDGIVYRGAGAVDMAAAGAAGGMASRAAGGMASGAASGVAAGVAAGGGFGSGRLPGSIMPMPQGGPPDVAFVVPELIASIAGAMVGSWAVVKFVAPVTEWPAFYLRPNADVSCYRAEVGYLGTAANWSGGTAPVVGPATTALIPPVVPTGPAGPAGPTPPFIPTSPVGPSRGPETPDVPEGESGAETTGAGSAGSSASSGSDVLDDPQAEMDRINRQWKEASRGVDPNDPGYADFKKQYDDYRASLQDKIAAADAARAAAEAEARAAAEAAAAQAEWVRQREEDLKQVREQGAFIAATAAGARAGGFDASAHDRAIRDLEIREKELAKDIAAAGGDTSYTARPRDVIPVGEGFKEAIRIAQEQKRQEAIAAARAKLEKAWEDKKKTDSSYWQDVKDGFWGGVVSDVDAIPGQLKDAAKAGLKTIGETVRDAGQAITDPNNWKALGQAVVQTGADLVGSPIQSAKKVGGFYGEVGATVGKVAVHVVTHPVETIKAIAGVDNWEKSMDPNVPVTERIGRVLVGIADAAVNIAGAGFVSKGGKLADAAADAVKVADKAADAVRSADKVLDSARAADKASDAAKGARAADKAGDARNVRGVGEPAYAPRGVKATEASPELAAQAAKDRAAQAAAKKRSDAYFKGTPDAASTRHEAWKEAQAAGRSKVDEFDKARREAKEAWKSGDKAAEAAANERLRKATLEVQGDKQALWDINKRPDAVKKEFNREMGNVYRKTDDKVVRDLCEKNGIPHADLYEQPKGSGIYYNQKTGRPDIVIVKPTNPKAGISVGADRDVTVRVRKYGDELVADPDRPGQFIRAGDKGVLTDVPSKDLAPVYDDAFHEAAEAGKHFPGKSPKEFAHTMDQVATDRLHAEAYGRGQKDLATAIRKPGESFSDVEQVSKAAQYKSEHLYQQSRDLAAQGRFQEAETAMGEGMRQSTKQFDRQVLGRAEALKQQGVAVNIPQRLKDDIGIMKKAQTDGWSPARITEELKKRGTTVEDVTQRSASMLETMQKLRPR